MLVKLYKTEQASSMTYDVVLKDVVTGKVLYELQRLGISRFDRCEVDFTNGELICTVSTTIYTQEGGEVR
jgi:hypothetical protein